MGESNGSHFMKKLFGTDGIRGHAAEFPLDENTVRVIGASLARQFRVKLGRDPRFVTGRDTRESGSTIENAFHLGAHSENAVCESSGVITTPGVAYLTKAFDFDAGIVISASHNPYQDNGIKIFLPSGKKIDEDTERATEADVHDGRAGLSAAFGADIDSARSPEFQAAYLNYLRGEFDGLSLKNYKMVVDCANGAATEFAPLLFRSIGADVIAINDQPNGRNINENCGSLHLKHLQARVLEEKADFGVAFDGDADRALFVDEKGAVVDGDATMWILAQYFQSHGKLLNSTIVSTVMSNIGLEIALDSMNIRLVRALVGDKYVLEKLIKTKSEIGGEQSGHIIIPEKSFVGDGMMTSLFVFQALSAKKNTLSEMAAGFVRYPQILVNVKVREKRPFETIDAIAVASKQVESELNGDGRLLLRYSGTENLARVMIEGKDQAVIESQARRLAGVIEKALG